MLQVTFAPTVAASKSPSGLAILIGDDLAVPAIGAAQAYVTQAITAAQFKAKKGESLVLVNPGKGPSHLLLIGLGNAKEITPLVLEETGGSVVAAALAAKLTSVSVLAQLPKAAKHDAADAAARIGFGAKLRGYRFDKYRTKQKPEDKPKLNAVQVVTPAADKAKKIYTPLAGVAESIHMARDLVTEPANILYPATLAAEARKLSKLGIKVEVLGEAEMKKLGMGSLLGVGQGSERESQLVVMQYYGGKKGAKPVALIGKGVTFDTGGISIKPAAVWKK